MSSGESQRGLSLPRARTLVVLGATLCALWLAWGELCERGLIPWVTPPNDQAVVRIQAVESLIKRGSHGVPTLVDAYSDTDPKVRRSALIGLGRIGPDASEALGVVRKALSDPDPMVRANAVHAFGRISQNPGTVGLTVGRQLADPNDEVRQSAAATLQAMGLASFGPAIDALRNEPAAARLKALFILREAQMRLQARSAPDELRHEFERLAEDSDEEIRMQALMTLAGYGWANSAQIRELLRSDYEGEDDRQNPFFPSKRRSVDAGLSAISRLGPDGIEYLPDLLEVLDRQKELEYLYKRDNGPGYQVSQMQLTASFRSLINALAAMQQAAQPAAPALAARVAEISSGQNRIQVAETLFAIGARSDEIARIITPLLDDGFGGTCYEAGRILAKATPEEAARQVELRLPILQGTDDPRMWNALCAVSGMARQARAAIPVLIELARADEARVANLAVQILGRLGPDAAPAVPVLLERLSAQSFEDGPHLQQAASLVVALGKIGAASRPAVPKLLEILSVTQPPPDARISGWGWEIRRETPSALGRIGDARPEVVDALRARLADPDPIVKVRALRALALLAPDSPAVLSDCLALLTGDGSRYTRVDVMLAIGELTGDRREAIGPLTEALAEDDPQIRAVAAMTLGKIAARDALGALREVLAEERNIPPSDGRGWFATWLRDEENDGPLPRQSVEEAIREALEKIEGNH